MNFQNPYKCYNSRLEITQLETSVNSLEKIGDVIEDILLHQVPVQYHLPITPTPITLTPIKPSRKRKVLSDSDITTENHVPSAITDGDERISKLRKVEGMDTSMSGTG
jgi:hypothetical protein